MMMQRWKEPEMLAKVTFAVFAAFAFIKYCMQGKDDEEENESRVRREMSEAGVDQVERNKKRNGVLDYDEEEVK